MEAGFMRSSDCASRRVWEGLWIALVSALYYHRVSPLFCASCGIFRIVLALVPVASVNEHLPVLEPRGKALR